jgi:NAD(P)-dependent dehydrogenase (short-subunit alcohol dehydrogenase family)
VIREQNAGYGSDYQRAVVLHYVLVCFQVDIKVNCRRGLQPHPDLPSSVNIASTHGVVALAQRATYGISKAGVIHMSRMLAFEWAQHGIRVNAIAPGTIETPSRSAYFAENPQARAAMLARVPAGHFGTPEDVAGAVAYLAGADGAFVTRQTLLLDGGLTTY